jgi:hypothetical protein
MGNNIKMDPKETGWENVGWIHLAEDRDQHCNKPSDSIKYSEFLTS